MIVESSNPAHSLADSQRFREAFEALELVVVIDVAMTETARLADYVLPAASQYEKPEATFFNLEFPRQQLPPAPGRCWSRCPGTLPEPEIWARLVRALGVVDPARLEPLREAAREGREAYAQALMKATADDPALARALPYVLYETLGPTLPEGLAARRRAVGPRAARRDDVPGRGPPRRPRRRRLALRRDPRGPVGNHLHARRVRGRLHATSPIPTSESRSRSPSCWPSCAALREARPGLTRATTSRSCSPSASGAPTRRTTSSATPAGASATPTARCA